MTVLLVLLEESEGSLQVHHTLLVVLEAIDEGGVGEVVRLDVGVGGLEGFEDFPRLLREAVLEVLINEGVDGDYGGTDVEFLDHELEERLRHQHLLVLEGVINQFVEEDVVGAITEGFDSQGQDLLDSLEVLLGLSLHGVIDYIPQQQLTHLLNCLVPVLPRTLRLHGCLFGEQQFPAIVGPTTLQQMLRMSVQYERQE